MKDLLMIMFVKKLYLVGVMLLAPSLSYAMAQEQQKVGFPQLPGDVQRHILSYCIDKDIESLRSLIQLSRVNKAWHTAINKERTIKFLIKETFTYHMNKNSFAHLTELAIAKKIRKMPGIQSAEMRMWYATHQSHELLGVELRRAINCNDLVAISAVLKRKYPINKVALFNGYLLQPLSRAVLSANIENVKFLINAGADVNGRSLRGQTPLMIAAICCHPHNQEHFIEVAKLLIEKGADVNAQSSDGYEYTAVVFAAYHGHKNILELFLKAGANPNAKSKCYGFALDCAISKNDPAIIELLRKHGALGSQDYKKLMRAAKEGDRDSIATLITKKININAQEEETGETPLIKAAYHGHHPVVDLLLKHKALVDIQDAFCRTALSHAVLAERKDMVEKLLLAGAHPHVETKLRSSPAKLAQWPGREDILALIDNFNKSKKS